MSRPKQTKYRCPACRKELARKPNDKDHILMWCDNIACMSPAAWDGAIGRTVEECYAKIVNHYAHR